MKKQYTEEQIQAMIKGATTQEEVMKGWELLAELTIKEQQEREGK